jgi:hypothetical protein
MRGCRSGSLRTMLPPSQVFIANALGRERPSDGSIERKGYEGVELFHTRSRHIHRQGDSAFLM